LLTFGRKTQTISHSVCIILYFTRQCTSVPICNHFTQYMLFSVLFW
jgi:hypothetical protein